MIIDEIDEIDRKILSALQDGFPLSVRPFLDLGASLYLDEDAVLSRIVRLHSNGLIRRIGPIIDMRKLGLGGILAALSVPVNQADVVAHIVNQYDEVSHNYLRSNESGYNLWFTVSASAERIDEILLEIQAKTGCKLLVLPTQRIFKIGVKFDIV